VTGTGRLKPTHTSHSAFAAGTGLHAPLPVTAVSGGSSERSGRRPFPSAPDRRLELGRCIDGIDSITDRN
jgi:hypothetical protein